MLDALSSIAKPFRPGYLSRRPWAATLERLSKGVASQYAGRPGILPLGLVAFAIAQKNLSTSQFLAILTGTA